MHLPPIPRFFVRWTIRLFLLLLFVCIPAAIVYLREVGIRDEWKERVAAALSGEGFQTQIGMLTVDPFKVSSPKISSLRKLPESKEISRALSTWSSP